MNGKRILKRLLFPPVGLMLLLGPGSAALLIYSLADRDVGRGFAVACYVLSAYTLTVWCVRAPFLWRRAKKFRDENKYVGKWRQDVRLRISISLGVGILGNTAYALLQLGLGWWHRSLWFCALAAYYLSLGGMRLFLVCHTRSYCAGVRMEEELRKYRGCGVVFLVMNLAISVMILFMVYWNKTFYHHKITTIAMAAYTFTTLSLAVVNAVRYRATNSPVYRAWASIRLAAACVSMLTLESTMLSVFSQPGMKLRQRQMLLGGSGAVVSVVIVSMAVYMIVQGTKQIKLLERKKVLSYGNP